MENKAIAADATVAIIIPHYNDIVRLHRCLSVLVPQVAATPRVEIIVADNNSTEDMGPLRASFPSVRYLNEPKKGAAEARNCGVAETDQPWIFFLDADCVPSDDWLAHALRLAGKADIVGGCVDTFDETPPPKSGAEAFETVYAFHQKHYIDNQGFSVTANLLTSRAVFVDTGNFINGVPEDIEWCRRATSKGHGLIYADDLRASHPTRSDWPALRRKWKRLSSEARQEFGTTPKRRLLWALRSLAVAGAAVARSPQILRYPGLSGGERLRALGTLTRLTLLRMFWMISQSLGLG